MLSFIITVSIAMAISFTCSILEACLLSLSTTDIAKISEKKPQVAKIWTIFKQNIQKPIAVILIVNTLSHTIGASLSGAQFDRLFGSNWVTVYSIVFSFIMIQWAEILPKTWGVVYNKTFANIFARPLKLLVFLFTPFVYIIQIINKPFEGKKKHAEDTDELNDISVLARFASLNKKISQDHANILMQAAMLGKKKVKDIMIDKNEIKYLSTNMTLMDALVEAHIHHHTRFPLIKDHNVNDIIGYVNFKDIVSALQINPTNPSLTGIARPIIYVNDTDSLSVMLNKLTKSYQHIAVVKNNDKQIVGLVTLEDVIEAIVGDINDEYDILPSYYYQIAINRFLAGGGANIQFLNKEFNFNLPDTFITLNEWLLELTNHRIPKIEERIKYKDFCFIIRKLSRSQIFEIIIEKCEKE